MQPPFLRVTDFSAHDPEQFPTTRAARVLVRGRGPFQA